MKNVIILFLVFYLYSGRPLQAQMLNIGVNIQEQDQWCWAGVSKSILDYYGDTTLQCEIAEYVRNTASWHNFGVVDCCNDPTKGCNYWNYNYGYSGSIKDILSYFAGINNYGIAAVLSEQSIANELSAGRPFVIRWGWYSGGGHFVLAYGKQNHTIYYMNPWFGEGMKFAAYNWVKDNGIHQWTHTNVLTTSPMAIKSTKKDSLATLMIIPNPSEGEFVLKLDLSLEKYAQLSIFNLSGRKMYSTIIMEKTKEIPFSLSLARGLYMLQVVDGDKFYSKRFIVL